MNIRTALSGVASVAHASTHITSDIKGALKKVGSLPQHIGAAKKDKDDDSAVSGMTSSVMTKEEKKAAKKEKKLRRKEKEKKKQVRVC